MAAVKVGTSRQVVIPKKLHDQLGLAPGDYLEVTVAALAERREVYQVLTTDRRDFSAIRIGPRLSRALELLP